MTLPRKRLNGVVGFLVVFLTFFPITARSQSAPARDYLNTPVNQARFFLDFVGSSGETAAESDLPLPDNESLSRLASSSLLWSFPLGDRYGGVAVSGNYVRVKFKGPQGTAETSGFGDPSVTFHANIFGAPALSLDQFPHAVPQSYLSFHLSVNAPLGSYDRNSLVNAGANRWAFTPILNLCITPDKGVSWIEFYAGVRFFTDNDEFQGNKRLAQNPLATFTVHYSHNLGPRTYASIGLHYDFGGESYVNGVPQHDEANGFRPAISLSRAIGKFRVTLRYENTASTPRAAPTNGLLSLRLSGPLYPF
jgi:Putative MetA-pathway of phenol degradation